MQPDSVKTVLVTGANGFIGSRICGILAASGYAVRIIKRSTSDLSLLKDIPVEPMTGDITDPESLKAAVTGVDYIIHLAGLIKARSEAEFMRVNQQGVLNLLNAVKNNNLNLKKFVLVSSVAAAGPAGGRPRKESDPPAPLTAYGRSKLAGEQSAKPFFDLLPLIIIRPPAVYGPGDKAIFSLFEMAAKGIKPLLGGGKNKAQMIYVDDLARAIIMAMESERGNGQAFFIAEQKSNTVAELMDIMSHRVNRRCLPIYIPRWLVMVCAFFSEKFSKLFGKAPLFSLDKARELMADWELDVSAARDILGFEAEVDFNAGAERAVNWYRREGWLK